MRKILYLHFGKSYTCDAEILIPEFLMKGEPVMPEFISPATINYVLERAKREGLLKYELVGKIIHNGDCIAEKLIIFWSNPMQFTCFRAKPQKFGNFITLTYVKEKYYKGRGNYEAIMAEINAMREEYTSGIMIGNKKIY